MNSSSISILFSTNAESVTDSIKKLRDANEQLAASLDDVQDQANQADNSLDDLAASSNRVDTSMSNLNGATTGAGLSIGKLIPAAAALAATKVALDLAVKGAVATFNAYIATNDQARIRTEALTAQVAALRGQFAEAALGGGNFEEMMTGLEQATTAIGDALEVAAPLINTLVNEYFVKGVQYGADLVEVFVALVEGIKSIGSSVPILGELYTGLVNLSYYADPINLVRDSVGGIADVLRERESDLVNPINMIGSAANTTTGILTGLTSEFNSFLDTANGFNNSFVSDLLNNESVSASPGRSSRSSGSSIEAPSITGLVERQGQTWDELYNQFRESEERRLQAAQDFQDREVASAQERADALLAIEENLSLKRKQESEAFYQQQEEEAISRTEKLNSILGEGGSLIGDALSSSIGAAMDGKDFGKSVLKSFGDYLTKKGAAMITEGSVDTLVGAVSGNPQQVAAGAAKLGGGAALIAAGKGLGAAGKDGKKASNSGTPSTPPAQAQPVQNTYNVSTNVGMAGDMRAFGREISYQNDKARRLGYT